MHLNFFHAIVDTLALTPLLERFEAENGTLVTVAMFLGRELLSAFLGLKHISDWKTALSTIPAAIYLLIERGLLKGNTAILGSRCACHI